MRRNSSRPTRSSIAARSASTEIRVSSSFSPRARSNRSCPSARLWPISCRVRTTPSRDFFSLPRPWARWASSQTLGSSSSRESSSSFDALASKSKIPPQVGFARFEVGEAVGDGVEAFGFHGEFFRAKRAF
jgi:hypothetical protein